MFDSIGNINTKWERMKSCIKYHKRKQGSEVVLASMALLVIGTRAHWEFTSNVCRRGILCKKKRRMWKTRKIHSRPPGAMIVTPIDAPQSHITTHDLYMWSPSPGCRGGHGSMACHHLPWGIAGHLWPQDHLQSLHTKHRENEICGMSQHTNGLLCVFSPLFLI